MIYPKAPFHDGVVFRGFCFIVKFLFTLSCYVVFLIQLIYTTFHLDILHLLIASSASKFIR
jgi:hypothetical protein